MFVSAQRQCSTKMTDWRILASRLPCMCNPFHISSWRGGRLFGTRICFSRAPLSTFRMFNSLDRGTLIVLGTRICFVTILVIKWQPRINFLFASRGVWFMQAWLNSTYYRFKVICWGSTLYYSMVNSANPWRHVGAYYEPRTSPLSMF